MKEGTGKRKGKVAKDSDIEAAQEEWETLEADAERRIAALQGHSAVCPRDQAALQAAGEAANEQGNAGSEAEVEFEEDVESEVMEEGEEDEAEAEDEEVEEDMEEGAEQNLNEEGQEEGGAGVEGSGKKGGMGCFFGRRPPKTPAKLKQFLALKEAFLKAMPKKLGKNGGRGGRGVLPASRSDLQRKYWAFMQLELTQNNNMKQAAKKWLDEVKSMDAEAEGGSSRSSGGPREGSGRGRGRGSSRGRGAGSVEAV
jgi:hypothetical protein